MARIPIDERTVLAMLPGRLLARRLMNQELAIIKDSLSRGENRHYIALLPGLEEQAARINEGLADLGILMGESGSGHISPPVEQRQLSGGTAAPAVPGEAVPRMEWHGKPTFRAILLQAVHEIGPDIPTAELQKRLRAQGMGRKQADFYNQVNRLRKAGIDIILEKGYLRVMTPIDGAPVSAGAPVSQPKKGFPAGLFSKYRHEGTKHSGTVDQILKKAGLLDVWKGKQTIAATLLRMFEAAGEGAAISSEDVTRVLNMKMETLDVTLGRMRRAGIDIRRDEEGFHLLSHVITGGSGNRKPEPAVPYINQEQVFLAELKESGFIVDITALRDRHPELTENWVYTSMSALRARGWEFERQSKGVFKAVKAGH